MCHTSSQPPAGPSPLIDVWKPARGTQETDCLSDRQRTSVDYSRSDARICLRVSLVLHSCIPRNEPTVYPLCFVLIELWPWRFGSSRENMHLLLWVGLCLKHVSGHSLLLARVLPSGLEIGEICSFCQSFLPIVAISIYKKWRRYFNKLLVSNEITFFRCVYVCFIGCTKSFDKVRHG